MTDSVCTVTDGKIHKIPDYTTVRMAKANRRVRGSGDGVWDINYKPQN